MFHVGPTVINLSKYLILDKFYLLLGAESLVALVLCTNYCIIIIIIIIIIIKRLTLR